MKKLYLEELLVCRSILNDSLVQKLSASLADPENIALRAVT